MVHSDKIIIDQIKKGNESVFRSAYESYYPHLVNYALHFVHDRNICEDITQDVFANFWTKRRQLEIRSLKHYLQISIRNKCISYLRTLDIEDNDGFVEIESLLQTMDYKSDDNIEYLNVILESVKKLPPQMQRIFKAKYVYSLTAKEISEDLGLTENTVNTQLKRAKEKIRKIIFEEK